MAKERIGLIDIGSNTVRLVVFEMDKSFIITELQNIKTPARLSQYLNEDHIMSQSGIDTLITILKSFSQVIDYYHVKNLMPIATAAVRQSTNQADIIKQVKEKTGLELTVLSEEKEAFYGQYAVLHTTQYENGVTVDIGGGSTEVTYFKDKKMVHYHSFPFGVVTLHSLFFSGKAHNDSKGIKKAQEFVKEQFSSIGWLTKLTVPIIAIGGSARNIANIHQRQTNYPIAGVHGYRLPREALEFTFTLLKNASLEELEDLDGLSRDRTDIILPANIVFNALYDEVRASMFIFSNKGLREGIILEYINLKYGHPYNLYDIGKHAIEKMEKSYRINPDAAHQRVFIVDKLFKAFSGQGYFQQDPFWKRNLHSGTFLYYLGTFIEPEAGSQHTFYIVSNSNLNGITHKERLIIAFLASYKNKSLYKQYMDPFSSWFSKEEIQLIQSLGSLVKFSEALNDSHLDVVKDIELKRLNKKQFELIIHHHGDVLAEDYRASRQKKHLSRILDSDLSIRFVAH